jgi:hypothetical protein
MSVGEPARTFNNIDDAFLKVASIVDTMGYLSWGQYRETSPLTVIETEAGFAAGLLATTDWHDSSKRQMQGIDLSILSLARNGDITFEHHSTQYPFRLLRGRASDSGCCNDNTCATIIASGKRPKLNPIPERAVGPPEIDDLLARLPVDALLRQGARFIAEQRPGEDLFRRPKSRLGCVAIAQTLQSTHAFNPIAAAAISNPNNILNLVSE